MSSSRHLTPQPHLLFDIIAPLIPLVYLLCLLPPRDPQVENVSSMGAGLRLAHRQVPSFGTQLLPSSSPAATVPTLLQTLISHQAPPLVSPLVSFLYFSLLFWSLFFTLLFLFIGNRESGSQAGPEQICDAGRGRGGRSVASLRFSSGVRRRVLRDMATVLPPSAGGQRSLAAAARLLGPKGGSDYRCAGEFPLRALALLRSNS